MQDEELRDDIVAEHELVHFYPNPVLAAGILIWGDDDILPSGSWLEMLKSREDEDEYELTVNAHTPSDCPRRGMSALECMDRTLMAMGMPPLKEMLDPEHPFCLQLESQSVERNGDCVMHMNLKRDGFKAIFSMVAESDYVQLFPEVDLIYVMEDISEELRWQLEAVFRRFFPLSRWREKLEIMPMIDRDLELVGFITYHPYHIFTLLPDEGEFICETLGDGWTKWQEWRKSTMD